MSTIYILFMCNVIKTTYLQKSICLYAFVIFKKKYMSIFYYAWAYMHIIICLCIAKQQKPISDQIFCIPFGPLSYPLF